MKMMTRSFRTLGFLAVLTLGAIWGDPMIVHAAEDKSPETKPLNEMTSVLERYYLIQQTLASDQVQGVSENAVLLISSSKDLKDKKLSKEINKRAQKLAASVSGPSAQGSISKIRENFKELSKPIAAWVKKHKPAGWSVLHCPMAGASWVQKEGDIQNPYYGKEMLSCGAKVS